MEDILYFLVTISSLTQLKAVYVPLVCQRPYTTTNCNQDASHSIYWADRDLQEPEDLEREPLRHYNADGKTLLMLGKVTFEEHVNICEIYRKGDIIIIHIYKTLMALFRIKAANFVW